ncbi:hypothetical protein [Corallibacter sp.]|uniref:hypothetical protein n=1 Tax=Corallibacter sp. TaxID=2038084 RepID=UPI003AB3DA50
MRSKFIKNKRKRFLYGIIAFQQIRKIKSKFPNVIISNKKWDGFEALITLQPTPLSEKYDVKIEYIKNCIVKVYVVNRVLKIAENRKKLPHVYSTERQQLCLFSPSKKEWDSKMYISDTIIPWASEWLYYYELWIPKGKWYGGGHNEYPDEENSNTIKDE